MTVEVAIGVLVALAVAALVLYAREYEGLAAFLFIVGVLGGITYFGVWEELGLVVVEDIDAVRAEQTINDFVSATQDEDWEQACEQLSSSAKEEIGAADNCEAIVMSRFSDSGVDEIPHLEVERVEPRGDQLVIYPPDSDKPVPVRLTGNGLYIASFQR